MKVQKGAENMKLDTTALYVAFANSGMKTKDILERTELCENTWLKARRGGHVTARTAGRIAKVLGVSVKSLILPNIPDP